jgi:peptidoglycan hydrolase-like protein with peptidoglycan-binding domain
MDILGGGLVGRPAQEIGKPFDVLQPRVDPVAADDLDDEARLLQRDLNTLGADPQLEVDGRFGKQTRLAVKEFQATAGIVADGIPGSVTMATIKLTLDTLRRSRVFGQVPGRNKLKAGSRLVVSPFPEIKFILSCCGVL